jgi:hypothetical protein
MFESSEEPASTMSYHEQAANCTSRERELTRATQDASTEPSTRSRSGVGGHTLETKDSPPSLLFGCMSASAKVRLSFAIAASPSSAASCIYRPLHISITSNETHDRNLPVRLSTAANRPSTSPPSRRHMSPYWSFPSLAFLCCRCWVARAGAPIQQRSADVSRNVRISQAYERCRCARASMMSAEEEGTHPTALPENHRPIEKCTGERSVQTAPQTCSPAPRTPHSGMTRPRARECRPTDLQRRR